MENEKNTNKKFKGNYNIGLDIGVGSVGWCVTDENNNIIKRNGKNLWGSRIFEEAQTAQATRGFRSNRRRLNRRKERINILQSLIQNDLEKEYPNFLPMLRETSLVYEDKIISEQILGKKYNLFSEEKITDASYYKQFPTIYHLRNYLVNTKEKVDIRLVYLAIHHIIKYRGNFLYEGDFSENTTQISTYFSEILTYLKENYQIELNINESEFLDILKKKNTSKSNKKDEMINSFNYEKQDKQVIVNIINSFLGYKFELNSIFEDLEMEKNKISFSEELENEEEIIENLQEYADIYEAMKNIYSWYILQDILNGKTYISEAFIAKYDKYGRELKLLKEIYEKYFKSEYNNMFRKIGTDNYVAYNRKNSGKTCKRCEPKKFFDALKKQITKLPDECKEKEEIQKRLNDNDFLKKINVTDNGAIPHQLHKMELAKILENQSKYYKTLAENKDNIIKLFEFRIPYYVGPLSKKETRFSWVIRKNNEKIRPWNFEKVVDEDATAEKFITRMTNKCTYILNEDVMPKQSLLYSKFCVLNELNNIRIDNHHIAKSTKKKIIDTLFKKKKKLTISNLKEFFKLEGIEINTITGLTDGNNFNSNMASYIDMEKIFGKIDEDNIEKIEKIIYWITIFEDKKILKHKIENEKGITQDQINKILKLKYTGWSRLSKKLIDGIKSYDGDTIIEKLEKTSMNFMQIINEDKYGFNKQLEELMPKADNKVTKQDIDEIPTSPANKRAIWQTICVVKEIVKIMKKEPKNIYIEFARHEEEKVMKDNRAKQLLKKYEEIEKQLKEFKNYDPNVYKELKKHQSDKVLTEKMYLYFIQNGKCLYSGKALNIDELDKYEVDHIIPQSYKKDDSIDNKALVIREENQRKKDNLLLEDKIIDSRIEWWTSLLERGLISQTKFYRLTKRKFLETDNEKENFINRQLVETRQITKHVTNLLNNQYKDSNIFALRAQLTHEFREKYKIYKNRNVNNFHHAHDAYILCVIGNILDEKWYGLEEFKYSDYFKNHLKEEKSKKEKYAMVIGFIINNVDIGKVKKILNYKDCYISRMLQEETGEFYNQTLYSPNDKKVENMSSVKNNRPTEKYGGYSGENKAFFVIYGYTYKGKKEYQLIGIPVKVQYQIVAKKENIEDYIKKTYLADKDYTDFKIIRKKILKNQEYLDENNEPMRFCSDTEIRPAKELIVNNKMSQMIYLMNSDERKLTDEEKEKIDYEYMFNYLLNKMEKEYKIHYNIYLKLSDKIDDYKGWDVEKKKATINGLINLMETGQGNLKEIGLTEREGRKSGQKFKTNKLLTMTLIDKSVTGIYERRFKINGLENCSSK